MALSSPNTSISAGANVCDKDGKYSRLLAVGTYERAVVGFELREKGAGVSAELTFTNAVHAGAVRCIASRGGILSSGGADEAIQLCDLNRRVELGTLQQHEGTVNCIEFHTTGGRSFMFSGSDDGSIFVWKCPRWECLHVLRGHRGAVNSFSLHSSGRLALSVGRDRTLRTWNLISGRLAYTTRLPKVGQVVKWSPDGTLFAVLFVDSLYVYDAASVSVKHQLSDESRQLTTFMWVSPDRLLLGTEEGRLLLFQIGDGEEDLLFQATAHKKRVKAVTAVALGGSKVCAASVGSDSKLNIWNVQERSVDRLCSVNVPGRPTCMTFCDIQKPAKTVTSRILKHVETSGKAGDKTDSRKSKRRKVIEAEDKADEDESVAEQLPGKKKKKMKATQTLTVEDSGDVVDIPEKRKKGKKKKRE